MGSNTSPAEVCILVADDNKHVRDAVCSMLADAGYEVLAAGHGSQVMEIARSHDGPIHLLLTDISMPEVDGIQLAKRVQAVRPGIRVLLMSLHDNTSVAMGPDWPFIQKPFSPAALIQRVREMLSQPPEPPRGL